MFLPTGLGGRITEARVLYILVRQKQLVGPEIGGHVRLGVNERRHVGALGWRATEIQTSEREPPPCLLSRSVTQS